MMRSRTIAYLNLTACIALWASIPVTTKKILVDLSHLQMLSWSTVFSLLAMVVLLVVSGRWRRLQRLGRRDYGWLLLLGFLGAYLYYVLLYAAIDRTTGAEGFILAYTWPLLISLLAVPLLGERLTRVKLGAVVISFAGVIVIVTKGSPAAVAPTNLVGDLLALSGAFVFALFSVLGKRRSDDQIVAATLFFVAALAAVLVTAPVSEGFPFPSRSVWPWLLYNGLLVNGISYYFWFTALEHGDTFVIATSLYLTPVLSLVYVYFFLDEAILPSHILGLGIILAGLLLQSWYTRKNSQAIVRLHAKGPIQ